MAIVRAYIEMELAGVGAGWTQIEDIVRAVSLEWSYGIRGHGPHDRVGDTGTLTFALDNSTNNSGKKLGYYSPGHANARAGFGLGIGVRLRLEYSDLGVYYKWRGVIDSIRPIPGTQGERRVLVSCVDWMDEAARATVRGLEVQFNQRSDQLFQLVVDTMVKPPPAREVGFGMEQYPYALDGSRDEGLTVLAEFQKLAQSEIGFIFVKGDPAQGGTLVFEDRRKRGTITTPVATVTVFNELTAARSRDEVINRVLVKVHPRLVDDVSGVSPTDIAGLTLWLEANDLVLNDGDPVSSWPNAEAGSGNFTATGTGRPTFKTGIVNGNSIIRFDGSDDALNGDVDFSAYFTAAEGTMLIVAKKSGTTQDMLFGGASANPQIAAAVDENGVYAINNDGTEDSANKTGNTTSGFFILTWMHSAGNIRAGLSDTRDASLASVASGNTAALSQLPRFGATAGAASVFTGDIAECIIYNAALSEAERKDVESYLSKKYDIAIPYEPTGTGEPTTIVFKLDDRPFIPRNTSIAFVAPYKDPAQAKARIGAVSALEPVATDDYLFNSLVDSFGVDRTSQLSVVATFSGNAAYATVTNNGPYDGYLTFFRIRGQAIRDEGEVVSEAEDTTSQSAVGENTVTFDMPYQSSQKIAHDAAYYLLSQSKSEYTVPTRVGFIGADDATIRQAILREPSDRVHLLDPVSAIDDDFFINGVELSLDQENVLRCGWTVVPAATELYWILDSATQSQLGQTTRLAYGLWNRYWILGIAKMGVDTRLS